jgi:glycosyltransferase involved in cell wall biosynthesis
MADTPSRSICPPAQAHLMTSPAAPISDRPRRVLAWPRALPLNPMVAAVHDGLEQGHGWRVAAFTFRRAALGDYSVLHISFPSDVFRHRSRLLTNLRCLLALGVLRLARLRRRRIVWTVHNLVDHEGHHPALEARFMGRYIALVDLAVHMSDAGHAIATERYQGLAATPAAVIPHPHYPPRGFGADIPRDAMLRALSLPTDCEVILAFGVVRRYKNLLKLIQAFRDLPGKGKRLVIAGFPLDAKLAAAMHEMADDRIVLMLRAISDAEVAALFQAATLVVAPYLDILNSGAAFLALSHRRPTLVPSRGGMAELQRQVGTGWVKLFDAPMSPLVLGDALDWASAPRNGTPDLTPFAPARVVASYDRALTAII